jgi:DNA-directed RNA polymerase subunit M/transcription elongation factor TFIIS
VYFSLYLDSRQSSADEASIFDPTTPQVDVICPECGYDRAVFLITPDENETKLVAKMMCASIVGTVAKCGNIW